MGNEMGNNNVSGVKDEEKAAVEVADETVVAVPGDELQGENHVAPGNETEDFHGKGEELSSNGLSAANDLDIGRHGSNEKDNGGQEPKHETQSQEVSSESNNSDRQESHSQKSDSLDESNYEKSLQSNLEEKISSSDILQIHDQPSIGKETDDASKEVEETDSTDSETTSQPSKSSNHSARSLEDCQCLLSDQNEEETKMNATCNSEETVNDQKGIETDEHLDDLASEETQIVNEQETNTSTEKCDNNSKENKSEDGLEDQIERNSNELSDNSSTEVVLQYSSIDPSVATPETQEKSVIHAEEIDLISIKSEKGVNKQESDEMNLFQKTVNELIINNSAQSLNPHDVSSQENGEEIVVQLSSNSGLEKVYHTGEDKMTHKRSESILAGNKNCASVDEFEDIGEVIKMLPTITSVSTQLSSTDRYDEQEKATGKTILEETEKREDVSSSMVINDADRGKSEEPISSLELFKWESNLLVTPSASQPNSQKGNATLLGTEEAEDRKKYTTIDSQDLFVNATSNDSNLDADKESMQIPASSSALESSKSETGIHVQTASGASEENEVLSNWPNQQCPSAEMSHLPNGKAQESSARLGIESNPGHPGNQMQRSKSPSFDFGFQLDAKCEDSDQTPLLHHDKTAARSFSGFANVRFQNRIIQTDYGRQSLDFEPVAVEEKTIRMERSDSDISRASFMNLLKKDERGFNAQFSPKKQESPVASNNLEELSTEELALTSVKGSGKRKSRPSIFTSCICCTPAIH